MTYVALVRSALLRLVVLGAVWWALVEGKTSTWVYAVVLVPVAVAVSLALSPPRPARGRVLRRTWWAVTLLGWFLWRSLLGGLDVARRALRPRVDVDPGLVEVEWHEDDAVVHVLVAAASSLTPGTLSVEVDGPVLRLHVLDLAQDPRPDVLELERRISAVRGVELDR